MQGKTGNRNQPLWYTPYANMRTDCYVLLAALLNDPPKKELITLIRDLQWDADIPEGLQRQLEDLNRACNNCNDEAVAGEFHRLFVGLGRGELVPYGSWYLEKMIQSLPLAAIRSDLMKLDIARQADTHESEDHAGALCEIMALLSQAENGITHQEQASFFDKHIASWMVLFFKDLQEASVVDFYRSVGAFGRSFLEAENEYLQNSLHYQNILNEGGLHDDSKIL